MLDQALYERILAFDIDGQEVQFGFDQRLAREMNRTVGYAERVVKEYKRFVYLTMVCPDFAVPSEAVDEAWHLHLTDSRSYWERFVTEVLGKPLHHEPNKGGAEDDDRHVEMYRKTLDNYFQEFEALPPRDIWPAAEHLFAKDQLASSGKSAAMAAKAWLTFAWVVDVGLIVTTVITQSIVPFVAAIILTVILSRASGTGGYKGMARVGNGLGGWEGGPGIDFDPGGDSSDHSSGHHGGGHDGGGHSGGHGCGGHGCGGHGCGGHGCGGGGH